ncbi:MAG: twin-arginine translocase subunit TatC [Pseudomonadota bacterium]
MTEPKSKKAVADPITGDEVKLQDDLADSAAPLIDHLTELRQRLIISVAALVIAFALAFAVSRPIFNFLVLPFTAAAPEASLYFKPLGFFFTQVRLSIFAAVIIAFPVIAYQIYSFVAPGLYKREQKAILPFLSAMPVLFAAGAALVYYVMIPFVMRFAVGFEATEGANAPTNYELLTDVGDYLTLVMTLIMAFGMAFQLPVLLTLFARAGLLTKAMLKKSRKFAIVGIFAIAAFLTPPDPFSQVVLALTIMALYEVSVFTVGMAEEKVKKSRENDLDDDAISA